MLQVINSSPGDLAPVFDAMLDKATRLCEAVFGILWTYDGDRYLAVALRNVPPEYAEFLREPLRVPPGTVVGQLAAGKQVAQIANIAAGEYYKAGVRLVETCLGEQLDEPLREQGCVLGRLQNDRVPADERGRELPGRNRDRKVPGRDGADDPAPTGVRTDIWNLSRSSEGVVWPNMRRPSPAM